MSMFEVGSETTFGHSKVFFGHCYVQNAHFLKIPQCTDFENLGGLSRHQDIHKNARKSKNLRAEDGLVKLVKTVETAETVETVETVKTVKTVKTVETAETVETVEILKTVETVETVETGETVEMVETVQLYRLKI